MSKATYLVEIYQQAVAELTRNKDEWKSLLEVMARYYKYSFDNNVLIYVQRPNAGLLADRDVWNKKIGRYINRGAKGIAVINMNNPTATLKHLFDVMDTNGDSESFKRVLNSVWQLENQYKPHLIKAFGQHYQADTASMETCLYDLVAKRIDNQLPQYMEHFRVADRDSILYDLPFDAVKEQFVRLIKDSVGGEAAHGVFDLNNHEGMFVSFENIEVKDKYIEIRANHFASRFLMPREFINMIPNCREWDNERILKWSNDIKVNPEALSITLKDADLINYSQYKTFKALKIPRVQKNDAELPSSLSEKARVKKLSLLQKGISDYYVKLCFDAYMQDIVSLPRIAEMLLIDE